MIKHANMYILRELLGENNMSKVKMVPFSKAEVINKIYTACRTCYSEGTPEKMWKDITYEDYEAGEEFVPFNLSKRTKLIKQVLKSGHHSTIEHVSVTFLISGLSRAASHQLVRHRLVSYSQQSQRYCEFKDGVFDYVTPRTVEKTNELVAEYDTFMRQCSQMYKKMVDAGIPAEDARMVLPNACCTNLTMTVNLRELIHICNERLCTCAQAEIRDMVKQMAQAVSEELPFMKEFLVPKCITLGYCNEPEKRSCGRTKTKKAQEEYVAKLEEFKVIE